MSHEYHVIYSVRYYPRFHVNPVGLGIYYPRIRKSACTLDPEWAVDFAVRTDVFKCKLARFVKVFVSVITALLSAVPGFIEIG
jgi:hypothetical protein